MFSLRRPLPRQLPAPRPHTRPPPRLRAASASAGRPPSAHGAGGAPGKESRRLTRQEAGPERRGGAAGEDPKLAALQQSVPRRRAERVDVDVRAGASRAEHKPAIRRPPPLARVPNLGSSRLLSLARSPANAAPWLWLMPAAVFRTWRGASRPRYTGAGRRRSTAAAISPLPLRCLSAASPLPLGCLSAASPLPLGYLSAASPLPLGCLSAASPRRVPEEVVCKVVRRRVVATEP